jgi:glycosyltransferase involved in cell wall biosynthesis
MISYKKHIQLSEHKKKIKKTIAIVANSTWNIYNFRLNVVAELIKRDYSVVVIAPIDDYISYLEKFPQVKHVNLPGLSRNGTNPLADIILLLKLRKIYKKYKPDLVVHYTVKPNIYGSLAARLLNIASISVITGLGYAFLHKGIVSYLVRKLYKLALSTNKVAIFENNDDRNLFSKEGLIAKEKGISIIGCGVDTDYFYPSDLPSAQSQITFSFIGRLLYDKGVKEFVQAAKYLKGKYPNYKFQIVGDLDQGNSASIKKEELLEWVEEENITYQGFKTDVRPIIENSHCIVLPSYREGFSRILMEAMSMARPIITTDTPGCRDAVTKGENGYLVPVKDAKTLAFVIENFAKLSPSEKRQLGINGRKNAVENFDDEKIANQIVDIIDNYSKIAFSNDIGDNQSSISRTKSR